MGMYDNVKVDSKFLPESIREYKTEWQTKSHDKSLNLLTIEEDGKLILIILLTIGKGAEKISFWLIPER